MHPVFATAREIADGSLKALKPILSPSWTQPVRPEKRPARRAATRLVRPRVHSGGGAFV